MGTNPAGSQFEVDLNPIIGAMMAIGAGVVLTVCAFLVVRRYCAACRRSEDPQHPSLLTEIDGQAHDNNYMESEVGGPSAGLSVYIKVNPNLERKNDDNGGWGFHQ